jgi:purine-nucleoside/S-methyl-5'-thioadenosine phosphorylase / adenosine deaminase
VIAKSEIRPQEVSDGFLSFEPLQAWDFLVHGFSTKPQGFKTAEEALQSLGLDGYLAVVPRQVHGTAIILADGENLPAKPVADGALTRTPGIALVVKVADCVALFLVDPAIPAIGLIHAGWRGASQGIIRHAVQRMKQSFGTDPATLHAGLAPAIQPCCYEVGEEVAEKFPGSVRDLRGGRWHLDLPGAVARELEETGVREENLVRSPRCTSCEGERFHSYRRDQGIAGRHYAILALRKGGFGKP